MITIIIVHYNTPDLLLRAIESVPVDIPILVVENSDELIVSRDPNRVYGTKGFNVVYPPTKMFHGDGLHFGIKHIKTPHFVCMDSDAYIIDPSIFDVMHNYLTGYVYGVGYVTKVDKHGHDDWNECSNPPYFPYLHPYFCTIDTKKYFECEPFVHHGAPGIYAMQSIEQKEYILKDLGLDFMKQHVHHDGRGTRNITTKYMEGWDVR
jgi:glycosyltransferase involved in cell wall biosynthesis